MPSPRLKRAKRRMEIFSPISAVAVFTRSSTVTSVFLMKSLVMSAFSFTNFSMRPLTIFSRMFSGLDKRSSFCISMSRSRATISWSASDGLMYSTSGHAATCMARSCASSLNLSPRATKSVSQLSSSKTPMREPAWM